MRIKKSYSLILSISSDIGYEIANDWLGKKNIIGTYLTTSKKTNYLKKKGVKLFKVNFKNKKSIDNFCKSVSSRNISTIISAVGTQEPIGSLEQINFDKWTDSILINAINQIRCLVQLVKNKKTITRIVLFAGGGTNNATKNYSAYTLSKIMLIKFTELIDFEMKNVISTIIGPGWVKTKIHDSTLKNKFRSGKNYQKTKAQLKSLNCVPMNKVVECINWVLNQKKTVISGRNLSLVYDSWGENKIINMLSANKNIYKLRRFGNEKLIRKKIINEKNYQS